MSMDANIRDQAYQFFIEEAPDLLQEIESGILTLRQDRSTAKVHGIMRAAHSLKGGSASVGLEAIKTISHRLETIFKALYSDTVDIDGEMESQLLEAYDCLRLPLMEQLQQGSFDATQALAAADAVLTRLESRCDAAIAETADFIPSSEDLGMSMAQSIFEVDVAECLDSLAIAVATAAPPQLAGELRAQADVLMGFAELLSLPGFGAIAIAAIQALDRHPEQVATIAQLALADWQAGRSEVLSLPESQGGSPSPELQALAAEAAEAAKAAEAAEVLGADFDPEATLELFGALEDMEALAVEPDAELPTSPLDGLSDPATPDPAESAADTLLADSLGQVMDQLEAVELEPEPEPAASVPTPAAPQATVTTEPVVAGLTVRVEAERLNRMNNLLGELTINRNGVDLQNTQLRGAVRELVGRFGRFQELVDGLRRLSDQMLIAPERNPSRSVGRQSGFDSLEMDSYTQLYSRTQTLLEELVQLEETLEDVSLFSYQSEQMLGNQRKMLSQMQDELMWARMIPVEQVVNRFPRVLRDLSNKYQKSVDLQLSGTDILVDKAVLAKLYDPLVQLLRNSFDHGIESPEERQAQGKPEAGQIVVSARYRGRQVVIEVRDDGRGLNYERICDRTIQLGLLSPAAAQSTSPERLSQFIFEPGFSTAAQVSELSGRGVGLDIVRAQIASLNGTIAVASTPGEGTIFTLTLPLTLTVTNLLICFVGSIPLAIRSDSIQEILVPTPDRLSTEGPQQFLTWQEQKLPAYSLAALLKYHCRVPKMPPSQVLATVPTPTNWEAPMLVLRRGAQLFALQVDRLVTEQEMVVKPFGEAIKPPIAAYGCTVMGDGSLVPVLDAPVFLDDLIRQGLTTLPEASEVDALAVLAQQNADGDDEDLQTSQAVTVLVVDDAVTLRRTLALSLERAGYQVLQARDGQEALEQLEQNPQIRLVICDVEMPNMNGFEFLTKRRETPAFARIPTMMLTSRGNDKHRWLAMKLGAVDYFTKPYLEQELLGAMATHIQAAAPELQPLGR